ncbi:MAG: DUF4446 family protein [Acidaminococcaceae bacterium]
MEQANMVMTMHLAHIIGVLAILILILFIMLWRSTAQVHVLQAKYDLFAKGSDNVDIGSLLTETLAELKVAQAKIKQLEEHDAKLAKQLQGCVQKLNVVRYNAFDEMGGEMSYSVAFLDGENNGVVLSSIYGREDNRSYGKPIKNGKSEHTLSKEEIEALNV